MSNLTISVIIPVYNVEKYLDKCIESIINQSYSNLEIILVDDKSTDSSPEICAEWKNKDTRIKVVYKSNNEGPGSARNTGLAEATGTYVSFIDSDDYLDTNAYASLVDYMNLYDADICYFACYRVYPDSIIKPGADYEEKLFDHDEIQNNLIENSFGKKINQKQDIYRPGSASMGFYKRRLICDNGIFFESEREVISGEDYLFNTQILKYANRVFYTNKRFYYYRFNGNSLCHSYRVDRLEKAVSFYNRQCSIISENSYSQQALLRARTTFLINIIVCVRHESKRKDCNYFIKRKNYLKISNDDIFRNIYSQLGNIKLGIKKRLLFFCLYYKLIFPVYLMGKTTEK